MGQAKRRGSFGERRSLAEGRIMRGRLLKAAAALAALYALALLTGGCHG